MKKNKPIDISGFKDLYPFSSRYMKTNGLNYHFVDEGQGDPLVMLHGNPTWSFYYRVLIKAFAGDFRTVVPDHIGCGLSDKPDSRSYDYHLKSRVDDLEHLLNYLGLDKNITLILHDWGGMIGMTYALRYPERIGRLVAMNTAAFLKPPDKRVPLRLSIIRNSGPFAALAVLGFNLFVKGALYMASHRKLSAQVKAGLMAPYNCWQNRLATLKFVQDIPMNAKDASHELVKQTDENLWKLSKLPLLICWGQKDFVFDDDFLAEWLRRFPNAEVHRFSDAGHYVLEDVPEKIVPIMKDFLKRHVL
jgi:cis-3-alkyl-4-acyloxetan-2-one decarboxylase